MNRKAASPDACRRRRGPQRATHTHPVLGAGHARVNRRLTALSTNRDTMIRLASLYAALAALALVAAACGGSSSPRAAGGGSPGNSASPGAVAYSACIRSHGVPNYPDPEPGGNLAKGNAQALGVSDSQFQAAESACQDLLPSSDTNFDASLTQCLENGDCPQAVVQRALTEGRTFAQCMRAQGVPNWPDPTVDSMGRPSFQVTAAGIPYDATRSAQMLSKIGHCQDQPSAVLLREE
jgi:hypothetical protein